MLPPFTDIRSVQTLVDGDKLRLAYGAQDVSAHEPGAYTGEVSGAMLAKLGCTLRRRRPLRAARAPPRGRRAGQRQGEGGAGRTTLTPILCVGEAARGPPGGRHVAHTLAQLDGGTRRRAAPSRRAASSSPTSRCGPSAPARWPRRRTPRRSARRSAPGSPSSTPATSPTACASSTAGRSRRRNVAGDHGPARRRRRARGRREHRRRGVRRHLPLPATSSSCRPPESRSAVGRTAAYPEDGCDAGPITGVAGPYH